MSIISQDSSNGVEYEETFDSNTDTLDCSWSCIATEVEPVKNPFLDRHKNSFPDFNSPSVFRIQQTPVPSTKPFHWSVEDMAILRPADIEELPNQEVVDNSYFMTPRRAEVSTKFFSAKHSIPFLMSPRSVTRLANRTNVNSTLKLDTPNPYSFSQPPEMLASPTPHKMKSPSSRSICPDSTPVNAKNAIIGITGSGQNTVTHSLAQSCSATQKQREPVTGVDIGVQTAISLSLDFDLEKLLGGYALDQEDHTSSTPSIRRILFKPCSSQTAAADLTSPVETVSPVIISNSTGMETSTPAITIRPNSYPNELPQRAFPDNESLPDFQETPKTTRQHMYPKSRPRSKSSSKRHPVSSFNMSSSIPGSFLMSLMSDKLECSNIPTAFNDVPCVSPIVTLQETDTNREIEETPGIFSPPKPSPNSENSPHQSHQPILMSPITSGIPSLQATSKSPTAYSTPFYQMDPATPPSHLLSMVSPSFTGCVEEPPYHSSGGKERFSNNCHEEIVIPEEDPPPLMLSDLFQVPDKSQATHSLECDSGIGSSYGEQSSLLQTQYKNRSRQKGTKGHQLSFSYSQDKNYNSISNDQVNKLRVKRNCVKFDSSPLSIVHRAHPPFNESQESKRYQLDSTGLDFSNAPPSPKETEIANFDPAFHNPGVVQQQAKQIETIEKLRNFNKWNTHKKNIEMRTNFQPLSQNLSPPSCVT